MWESGEGDIWWGCGHPIPARATECAVCLRNSIEGLAKINDGLVAEIAKQRKFIALCKAYIIGDGDRGRMVAELERELALLEEGT